MMRALRSLAFALCFWGWTLALGLLASPTLLWGKAAQHVAHIWVRGSLFLLRVCCGISHRIEGAGQRPESAAIYASKHQSAWDTLALWHVLDGPAFVLKRSLLWIPVFGWYLWRCNPIAIDRNAGSTALEQVIAQGTQQLASGRSIVMFPEGTRTAVGQKRRFKRGAVALQQASGAPLVPVALNAGYVWPRNRFMKSAGVVTLHFLPAHTAPVSVSELQEQIEQAVAHLPRP